LAGAFLGALFRVAFLGFGVGLFLAAFLAGAFLAAGFVATFLAGFEGLGRLTGRACFAGVGFGVGAGGGPAASARLGTADRAGGAAAPSGTGASGIRPILHQAAKASESLNMATTEGSMKRLQARATTALAG
jgi:hypothetical protein